MHIYTLLPSSPTYLSPTSFLPSILSLVPPQTRPYPYPVGCPPPSPPHHPQPSSFLTHPQLQKAWNNIHTHPHLSGNIREGESWRDVTACWRNRVPGTQTSLRSPRLCWNTTSSSPSPLLRIRPVWRVLENLQQSEQRRHTEERM